MTDCPFCGAKRSSPWALEFRCGTSGDKHLSQFTWRRSDRCYEAELAAKSALLKEAVEIVKLVAAGKCCIGIVGPTSIAHINLEKAQAFLDKVAKEVEG